MNEQNIEAHVMRRVRFVHGFKRFTNPLAVKAYICTALFFYAYIAISLQNVISNMPKEKISLIVDFYVAAFFNAELVVKAVFVAVAVILVLIGRDIMRKRTSGGAFA